MYLILSFILWIALFLEKFTPQKVLISNCLDVDLLLLQLIYTAGLECRCNRDFTQFALWEARLHPLFLLFRNSNLKSTAMVKIFYYSSFTEEEQMQFCCYFIRFSLSYEIHKANRCLARYSPRATSQPINRAPNEPAMVRNANFGPNWVVFGQKILFLLEKSKVLLPT